MRTCPACHELNEETRDYCALCGEQLTLYPIDQRRPARTYPRVYRPCPYCGRRTIAAACGSHRDLLANDPQAGVGSRS